MCGARVLIVEDEFLIRLTLAEALSDDGFEVTEAESADEAWRLMGKAAPFALLLTDVQLPGSMNGVVLAQRARTLVADLPVIFMTGRPDTMQRTPSDPRTVFIAKPYLPSQVCAAARRLVAA